MPLPVPDSNVAVSSQTDHKDRGDFAALDERPITDPHRGIVWNARHPGTHNVDAHGAKHAAVEQTSVKKILENSTPGEPWSQRDVAQHIDTIRKLASTPEGRAALGHDHLKRYETYAKSLEHTSDRSPAVGIVGAGTGRHDEVLTNLARPLVHKAHDLMHAAGVHVRPMGTGLPREAPPTAATASAAAVAGAPSEAPIELETERGEPAVNESLKVHPFNTISRLKNLFPGMSQKQRRQMLAQAHGISTASAGRYDRQYHSVPEGTPAEVATKLSAREREYATEKMLHDLEKGGMRHGRAKAHLAARETVLPHGIGVSGPTTEHEEQHAISPTPVPPRPNAFEGMHAYPYHTREGKLAYNHVTNPLTASVMHAGHYAAVGPEQYHKDVAAYRGGTDPHPDAKLAAKKPTAVPFRPGPFAPQPVPSAEAAAPDARIATRPDTFHHGMLDTIAREAKRGGKSALAEAAEAAKSNSPGAHAKVGRLLPDGHWAKDHDWDNEEQNQHLDNWVEEHASRLMSATGRTGDLMRSDPAKFWHYMHRQFGTGGGTNRQHDEFWNRMNREFRTKGSATKDHRAVAQFKGMSPQTMKAAMQAALERVRNKHVDQAHYRGT